MKTTIPLLAFALLLLVAPSSSAAWRGEVSSSSGASGRAAAFDAACLSLAADIGKRLSAESKTFLLFQDENHGLAERTAGLIARIWLQMFPEQIHRTDSVRGERYSCEVFLKDGFPSLTAVRRDLLTDAVLSDRRIHPLILLELTVCDDEREDVKNAFADRLSSPVLSDYFLNGKITSFSPSAAFELYRHPELLNELPPPELLSQFQALPGDVSIMKSLIAIAAREGRDCTTNWLWNLPPRTGREPKFVAARWPRVAEHARRAHRFVTPALNWFYATRRIFRHGSTRPPEDPHFAKAAPLAEAGRYREAYGEYLRSADLVLSYDACLAASACASRVDELAAEADFFLLQAVVLDPQREPARQRLSEREQSLTNGKERNSDND